MYVWWVILLLSVRGCSGVFAHVTRVCTEGVEGGEVLMVDVSKFGSRWAARWVAISVQSSTLTIRESEHADGPALGATFCSKNGG